ncbi:MAG: hypothetical protein OXF02_05605 [Simkaniaceae bacterium]|nr:hypothetical protein [Simkaniaceae bacterium]
MTTQLDTAIVSKSAPRESDRSVPVSFPKEEVEVVRKADGVGCGPFRFLRRTDNETACFLCAGFA